MTDNSELKRLAEAATPGPWEYDGSYICPVRVESDGARYVESWNPVADALLSKNVSYIAAANPAAVLGLLAENERLEAMVAEWCASGAPVNAAIALENDQLKAENEALRSQVQALQSDANSWQSGYDAGRLAAQTHVDSWRAEAERLRADARRLDWLADPDNAIGSVQLPTECVTNNVHSLRDAIDDAMTLEPRP